MVISPETGPDQNMLIGATKELHASRSILTVIEPLPGVQVTLMGCWEKTDGKKKKKVAITATSKHRFFIGSCF